MRLSAASKPTVPAAIAMAIAALLFALPAQAQEPPSDAPPEPTPAAEEGTTETSEVPDATAIDRLREKTIYVPYEKLEEVFEKEGRGIFLPYEEFLKLWASSLPKPPTPEKPTLPAAAVIRSAAYVGTVEGEAARLTATYQLEALAEGFSEIALPLDRVAVESITLSDDRALLVATGGGYAAILPGPGRYEAKLEISARVTKEPGKKSVAFGIPPTALSRLELTIAEAGARVSVDPAAAVHQVTHEAETTKLVTFLGNSPTVAVEWLPPAGASREEGAVLVAEQAIHTHLGERVLTTSSTITYSIIRGEESTFRVRIPEGMRLLSVRGENIREWSPVDEDGASFVDVELHGPVQGAYALELRFTRILAETPETLAIPFPRAERVLRESGHVVLGHESDLHVRVTNTTGLSQLDPGEIPPSLRNHKGVGFEYLAHPLALELAVERILPVVRANTVSVISLGTEEDTWMGWVDYTITKAGLFRLEMRVPERWSVASIGAPNTVDEDFQVGDPTDGKKTITVSLRAKALGAFRLPFRFTAEGSVRQSGERSVSPPEILGVEQDRGLLGVSTPRAYDLVTVSKAGTLDADVDDLFRSGIMSQLGSETGVPRAYRYRAQPAAATVSVTAKNTEIDVLAQHLVEVADSAITTTHVLDYNILYAAVDTLRFTAPATLENVSEKVQSEHLKELRSVSTEGGITTWELTLQSPTLGGVSVTLTHEIDLNALESGRPVENSIPLVHATDVRAERGFVAIQKSGTLEIVATTAEMESIDPTDLPEKLRRGSIYSAFRYLAENPTISLRLTQYEYETLATTVVNLIHIRSVLTPERELKTQATLVVQNTDRQYLEMRLAPGAEIFSLRVAGKTQPPNKRRKDTDHRLIPLPHGTGTGASFPVVLSYSEPLGSEALGAFGELELSTLEILGDVPVARVEVDLYLPPDYAYLWWRGNLGRYAMPGLWPSFKGFVAQFTDTAHAVGRPATPTPPPVGATPPDAVALELPVRDLEPIRFETLSPQGKLRFAFVGRRLFTFAELAAFVLAFGIGLFFIRKARCSATKTCAALILIPLVAGWFTTSAVAEVYTSVFAGGVLLAFVVIVQSMASGVRAFRERRRALAPDPFLEDVEDEGGADETTPDSDPRDTPAGGEPASPSAETPDAPAKPATDAKDDPTERLPKPGEEGLS